MLLISLVDALFLFENYGMMLKTQKIERKLSEIHYLMRFLRLAGCTNLEFLEFWAHLLGYVYIWCYDITHLTLLP